MEAAVPLGSNGLLVEVKSLTPPKSPSQPRTPYRGSLQDCWWEGLFTTIIGRTACCWLAINAGKAWVSSQMALSLCRISNSLPEKQAVTAGDASIEKFAMCASRRCTIRPREAPPTNNDSPRSSDNCPFPYRTARHGFAEERLSRIKAENASNLKSRLVDDLQCHQLDTSSTISPDRILFETL